MMSGGEQHVGEVDLVRAQAVAGGGQRERVQVDDAEDVVVLALLGHPVPDRAEVVPDVEVARGLDAGKDALAPAAGGGAVGV